MWIAISVLALSLILPFLDSSSLDGAFASGDALDLVTVISIIIPCGLGGFLIILTLILLFLRYRTHPTFRTLAELASYSVKEDNVNLSKES